MAHAAAAAEKTTGVKKVQKGVYRGVLQGSGSSSSSSDSLVNANNLRNKQLCEAAAVPATSGENSASSSESEFNYDKENAGDIFNVPEYAAEIFSYYRTREPKFMVNDYLRRQPTLSTQMRAILVDWMVETQENFELNHETLYLAVRMTDMYLDQQQVSRESLQLVGATAIFIASKFDERVPPCADDFLYICDDAYSRKELLEMEQDMLKRLGFDLGIPLSYRFLRRYAKACKVTMELLTLARYILETALLHYQFVTESDSKMAAAALRLALRMRKTGDWEAVHEHYSGYKAADLESLMWKLNAMLSGPPPAKNVKTVHTKYSHEVFFEVAKIAPLSIGMLKAL